MTYKEFLLGDLIEVKHGYAFPGEGFSEDLTFPSLVTPGNFRIGGGFVEGKPKTFTGRIPREYVLEAGDLIVTMTDLSKAGDTLGYSAEVPRGRTYLHNQRVGKILNKKPELLSLRYLNWVMRTQTYRLSVMSSATGTTVRHTSPSRIHEIPVLLPSLSTQEVIANLLGAIELCISANENMAVTLDEIAQNIFRSWFVDFEMVLLNSAAQDDVGEGIKTANSFPSSMEDSEIGLIPSGWSVRPVGDVLDVSGGTTPSTTNPNFWNGEFFWTTPRDLSKQSGLITTSSSRTLTKEGLSQVSSGLLPVNSVLMSCRAPIGYLSINAVPTAVNQGFITLRNTPEFSPLFVLNWLRSSMGEILNRAGGATFAEISRKAFKEIPMLVPSRETSSAYSELANPIVSQLHTLAMKIESLTKIRDLLLPRLISGELKIPEEMLAS